jgi:hypothetical protein
VLFRNKSQAATANIQINVMPAVKFKMRSVISGKELGAFTQADFGAGIPVPLSAQVEVLEVSTIA